MLSITSSPTIRKSKKGIDKNLLNLGATILITELIKNPKKG